MVTISAYTTCYKFLWVCCLEPERITATLTNSITQNFSNPSSFLPLNDTIPSLSPMFNSAPASIHTGLSVLYNIFIFFIACSEVIQLGSPFL